MLGPGMDSFACLFDVFRSQGSLNRIGCPFIGGGGTWSH